MANISKAEQAEMERLLENVGNLGSRYDVAPQQAVDLPDIPNIDVREHRKKIIMDFVLSINNVRNSFSESIIDTLDEESLLRIVKISEELGKVASWLRVARNNS